MVLSSIKSKTSSRGFTIVELVIVIVVIAILATISIVSYSGFTSRANDAKIKANVASVQKVAEAYNADTGAYPETIADFTTGSTSTKLPNGVTVIAGAAGTAGAFPTNDPITELGTLNEKTYTVAYSCLTSCTSPAGGRLSYWDFSTNARSANTVYLGSATATSDFVAP